MSASLLASSRLRQREPLLASLSSRPSFRCCRRAPPAPARIPLTISSARRAITTPTAAVPAAPPLRGGPAGYREGFLREQRLQKQRQPLVLALRRRPLSELADRCSLHVVDSPLPPIPGGPYPPLFEFVTRRWKGLSEGGADEAAAAATADPKSASVSGGMSAELTIDPNKVAMVDGTTGLERTFGDYQATTARLASALRGLGVDEDGCVALYCPNHVDYLPVTLAVSLLGAKLTPVNPLYTKHELEVVLQRSRSSVLVTHSSPSTLPVALETVRKCPTVKHVLVLNDGDGPLPEGCVDLHALCRDHRDSPVFRTDRVVGPQTPIHPFLLPYSSGTTGLPKGVVLTHQNIVANMLQIESVEGPDFLPHHKLITPLPFFHIYAFTVSMLYCAWQGQTMICASGRFDLEGFCRLVQEHRPERAHLVPPILLQLSKNPAVSQYDLSSLRMIVSAAAPLSKEIEADVLSRIGCPVKQAWGMSELSPIGTCNSDSSARSGSIGPLVASTWGKVVDDHGRSLPPRTPGELCIKGPQVMLGYMDEPDKTAECLSSSGWLRTGDLAYYDEDGYFYISDRLKELIKVRGYPVAPAELESLLLTHPAVGDCAVIQVPCDNSGELPRAYVVLKSTVKAQEATEDSIYLWVKERVAAYKRLDGGVVLCDSIPKSASGKILRRILRDRAKSEREQEEQFE